MHASIARSATTLLTCVTLSAGSAGALQQKGSTAAIDPALALYIARIKAIDSHAHPMRPIQPGAKPDTEYDALPLDGIPAFPLPWRLRLDNPEWRGVQQALYGFTSLDTGAAYRTALHRAAARALQDHGDHYAEWILDRIGTDVMLANRVALGPGLGPPRFRWVSFVDALMLPLDTRLEAQRSPDTKSLYPLEAKLLKRYMKDIGVTSLPATLDDYVRLVVTPVLERQARAGAVSVKFEAAYLRPLDFDDADPAEAARVYAKYAKAGTPGHTEYKTLEDYLFRRIAREAGRLNMAVQIHTTGNFGGFYSASGSAPYLLESAFNDSTLRGTHFIMVHGGWPLVGETESMLGKPNVYTDISAVVLFLEPSEVARALRQWLVMWPEKVLFGTDAFDGGPDQGWGEVASLGASTGRRALGIALTGMLRDGEITRTRAEQLARMVLRENALSAYHLGIR